ncbi:MAG: hypothetical protein ACYDBQ_04005 [Thermoplasmatota archaeon]
MARQESGRFTALLDRRALVALAATLALAGGAWAWTGPGALQPDRHLYPVAAQSGSPWLPALVNDSRFLLVPGSAADLPRGTVSLWLDGDVHFDPANERSVAAAVAFQQAVRVHLEAEMRTEANQSAAFPVAVNVLSVARIAPAAAAATAAPAPAAPLIVQVGHPAAQQIAIRPAQVQPPFPVRSLVMTFAYLIPMNFVAQLVSGSLLADRIRRRGVLLLSIPAPAWTVLAGRVAPYGALSLLVVAAAGAATGAGWVGWLAALPIVLVVLACGVLLGLLARHERELTFLLTGATTLVSIFLFLPAVFAAIPAVADVSPVTVVAASIRGEPVSPGVFLYATLPLALATVGLFLLAVALYREETLFSRGPLSRRTVQALATRLGSPLALVVAGLLAVPFAYGLELLLLSFAVPLGLTAVVVMVLLGAAVLEETLKLVPVRAQLASAATPWAGAWVGAGFFLGEKAALAVALLGFQVAPLGDAGNVILGGGTWLLLVAPLVLHASTTSLSAWGARRGRAPAWLGWLAAVAVHLAYNGYLVLHLPRAA